MAIAALTATETTEYVRLIAKMEAHNRRWEWIRSVRRLKQGPPEYRGSPSYAGGRGYACDNENSRRLVTLFDTIDPDNDQRLVEFFDDGTRGTRNSFSGGWEPFALRDCEVCARHHWAARMSTLDEQLDYDHPDQHYACQTCFSTNYTRCAFCERYVRTLTLMRVGGLGSVCPSHVENNEIVFVTCDVCGQRNVEGREARCNHDRGAGHHDDCVAPHLEFQFPANGKGSIVQDEPYTITIPGGEMDWQGRDRIAHLVYSSLGRTQDALTLYGIIMGVHPTTAIADPDALDPHWQAKNGNYTKRLSRIAYKRFQLSLPDGLISEVGNVAQQHTSPNTEFEITVTRDLNQPPIEFGNEGSCWWGGFGRSLCALKQNGGMALRVWGEKSRKERIVDPDTGAFRLTASGNDYKYRTIKKKGVLGRAWVLPLNRNENGEFEATKDAMTADSFMVFNPYGVFTEYLGARIIAHLTDKSYKKLTAFSSPHMYINNSTGVLVADQAILDAIKITEPVIALRGWKHP